MQRGGFSRLCPSSLTDPNHHSSTILNYMLAMLSGLSTGCRGNVKSPSPHIQRLIMLLFRPKVNRLIERLEETFWLLHLEEMFVPSNMSMRVHAVSSCGFGSGKAASSLSEVDGTSAVYRYCYGARHLDQSRPQAKASLASLLLEQDNMDMSVWAVIS